jgi:hypothetical protein
MKYFYLLFYGFLFVSCNESNYDDGFKMESKVVVEGWIEQGEVAQVILSRSVPIKAIVDSTTIFNYFIRSAKITVSDGVNSEVLSVRSDKDRIPPYVYYGERIIGEVGKKYSIKIEYLGKIIESTTSIPSVVPIISAKYVKIQPTDTTGYVYIDFQDPVKEKNYYQIATRVENQESIFIPAFYGNLNDENFTSEYVSLQVNRGISVFAKTKYQPYFSDGDLIYLKLKTMNQDAYNFWNSWENEIINGKSPIFPSNTSLKSNIKGGIGIWAGYGQNTILVQTTQKK